MSIRRAPRGDQPVPEEEPHLRVGPAADHAAGVKAVTIAVRQAIAHMGAGRTARTLARVN